MNVRLLAALVLLAPAGLTSQPPLEVGTATSLGAAAVTEARRADALAWNPALLGIYDGPLSSYAVLSLDLRSAPSARWSGPARRLGIGGAPRGLTWMVGPGGSGAEAAAGAVEWLSTQHRDFALSAATHHAEAGAIPGPIAEALGGIGAVSGSGDSTFRVTASVLSVGRGRHLGRLPMLGSIWAGATAKGTWVHTYARGSFLGAEPSEEVYRETVLHDVQAYGVDAGLLAQPSERLRLGLSLSNLVSGTLRPRHGPRERLVSVVRGAGGETEVNEVLGAHLGPEDRDTDDAGRAAALWATTSFPVVLRGGGTVETNAGSFSLARRTVLRDGGLDRGWDETPLTLAYRGPAALPVALSHGRGGALRVWRVGVRLGTCERRWNLSLARRSGPWGTTYGASAGVTLGSAAGCGVFRF